MLLLFSYGAAMTLSFILRECHFEGHYNQFGVFLNGSLESATSLLSHNIVILQNKMIALITKLKIQSGHHMNDLGLCVFFIM